MALEAPLARNLTLLGWTGAAGGSDAAEATSAATPAWASGSASSSEPAASWPAPSPLLASSSSSLSSSSPSSSPSEIALGEGAAAAAPFTPPSRSRRPSEAATAAAATLLGAGVGASRRARVGGAEGEGAAAASSEAASTRGAFSSLHRCCCSSRRWSWGPPGLPCASVEQKNSSVIARRVARTRFPLQEEGGGLRGILLVVFFFAPVDVVQVLFGADEEKTKKNSLSLCDFKTPFLLAFAPLPTASYPDLSRLNPMAPPTAAPLKSSKDGAR